MAGFTTLYLLAYNSIQAIGWAISLGRISSSLFATGSVAGAYASAGDLIWIVSSKWSFVAFYAMGGRSHWLLAIVRKIVEVQEFPAVFITFTAWSIAETIRYSHYALNCIGSCPSWVVYLRYTEFIVMYPIGLFPGEIWLMYHALPFVKKKNLYADFFAAFPFSYYNFLWAVILSYPFLWFKLYLHMLKQQGSKLGKPTQKKKEN